MTGNANFVALDVETANRSRAVCSVGIAVFENGTLVDEWSSLIDPDQPFDRDFVAIHGIDEDTVHGAPDFAEAMDDILPLIEGQVVVAHNSRFDRGAMLSEATRHNVQFPYRPWLDTLAVSRRIWPELFNHKLPTVCDYIGYRFRHHDALDDAKAAGHVLLSAMRESGRDMDYMMSFAT